ncbi:MAG: penicillin-binding transpeptidase domain-containing protein [Acidobacteriota bacterium]
MSCTRNVRSRKNRSDRFVLGIRTAQVVLCLTAVWFPRSRTIEAQDLGPAMAERIKGLAGPSHSAVLIWDISRSRVLTARNGEFFDSPRCVGSLLKPFLLLAYLKEAKPSSLSQLEHVVVHPCVGRSADETPVACWFKPGHGLLSHEEALAVSCNQYFYQLALHTSPESFRQVLCDLDLVSPGTTVFGVSPEAMIGLDAELRVRPTNLLQAYLRFVGPSHSSSLPLSFPPLLWNLAVNDLVRGFKLSAQIGTSALAQKALPSGQLLMGKTGTSTALRNGKAIKDKTDGWFLGFFPAAEPRLAVMVFYPGGLGAKDAAPLGGRIVSSYLELMR